MAAVVAVSLLIAPRSDAATSDLRITGAAPDFVTPGKIMLLFIDVQNMSSEPLDGSVVFTYEFPVGIEPVDPIDDAGNLAGLECTTSGQTVECVRDVTGLLPGVQMRLSSIPKVEPTASGTLSGSIEVSGTAVAQPVTREFEVTVGSSGPFAIKSLGVELGKPPAYSASQAGAGPSSVETAVTLLSEARTNFDRQFRNFAVIAPVESMRDAVVHVPAGFIGNPTATPVRCTAAQLTTALPDSVIPKCPLESQIGVVETLAQGDVDPIFNLVPPPGSPAAFGFSYNSIVITLLPRVRPSDHGIDIVSRKTPSSAPLPKFAVTLWGDPSNASHDPLRGLCLHGGFGYNSTKGDCSLKFRSEEPFLRNPTSCPGAPLPWEIEVDTYQHPGSFVHKSTTTPASEGCDLVPFDPSFAATPSSRAASQPSGLDAELTISQDVTLSGLAQSDLRSATVAFPEGVAINAASADGLAACTDAQLGLGLEGPASCPDAAKVGSVEVETPLLEETLGGSVFLRSQASQDPASGDLFRLAIELRSDERGLAIKLPGSLRVDPQTGQLSASFEDLPQLPFETMRLHLNSGPRAPLTTPSACGTYTTQAQLSGWSGAVRSVKSNFTIDQGCTPPAFDPGFEAGVADATAGEFAPFSLRVTRGAGQPNISRIDATLPEGELAKLAGVPVCSDAQVSAGSCPAGSRIGRVVTALGEGPMPLYIPQAGKAPTAVYLAGPYKGAPYSVLARVPAQAGPFDLGSVQVRSALRVDPVTTQASVLSDPLPQIFQGVPVSYRDVRVLVDRPEFTLNPTDCSATEVTGTISSIGGQSAAVSDRFQVGDCAALGFRPKLAITLSGKTRRAGNPALRAVLTMPAGGANIARASVALPHSEFIAQDHLNNVCTRVQYAAEGGGGAGCPANSTYGRARAFSPLLDRPLEGPVYLRSNGGERELPDLVASLDGAIHVDLVGYVDTDKRTEGLRTTFARVPDAPVSKFVLRMPGGRKSLLENSTNICRGKHRAIVKMDGQNGRIHDFGVLVRAKCGKGARKR